MARATGCPDRGFPTRGAADYGRGHSNHLCPRDYPTIQQAIDAAVDGDTILVAPGTYTENINFKGKAITVKSEASRKVTIIDGGQKDSVVTFASGEGRNSVLDGFTIRNGRSGFDTPGFGNGGGVRISNAAPTVLRNAIVDNQACDGLGVSIDFGSPLIKRNVISRNSRVGCGGGIGGGGIKIGGAAAAEIVENAITDNLLSANGGGISLFAAGTPLILSNVIMGNRATGGQGGGIVMFNSSDATIVGNIIVKNGAEQGGGIMWLVPSGNRGPLLVNNTIADNIAVTGSQVSADGFDTQTLLVNNLIATGGMDTAVYYGNLGDQNPPLFQYNNVFAPSGARYGGICNDQTGQNGNISVNPRFRDAGNGTTIFSAPRALSTRGWTLRLTFRRGTSTANAGRSTAMETARYASTWARTSSRLKRSAARGHG